MKILIFRILLEKKKQDDLLDEIDALKQKVASANEGLAAATRLSEQLEKKSHAISMLKHEVKLREDLLKKAQTELKDVQSNNSVKVDKCLVKNLVVGYVNADVSKKKEVLKVIATVLDFNQDEHDQTGLTGQNSGWLSSFFAPAPQTSTPSGGRYHKRTSSEVQEATGLDQSLAQAFVAFLQDESTPKAPLKVPLKGHTGLPEMTPDLNSSNASTGSGRSTPTSAMPTLGVINPNFHQMDRSASESPVLLLGASPGVPGSNPQQSPALPTFSVNRSSSSILKQVLQENSGQ